jgi:HAD superfamily hydrolase (TIGR01662 family)
MKNLLKPPRAVAFDLGNTLVGYYEREAFPDVLVEALEHAHGCLGAPAPLEEAKRLAMAMNREREDGKVYPLWQRLERIFGLRSLPSQEQERVSRAFLQPIFDRARKYEDSDRTLRALRRQGYKLAIVSNTPWGSPSALWREELARHGLLDAVDASVFCVDVGWRKPASAIFRLALDQLDVRPHECLFVGDEVVWDFQGALAAGMHAVLIDRANRHTTIAGDRVLNLDELVSILPVAR